MPISALPPATIRLLGSPLVITTPVSLVKELIENAIDAEATSVEVLVSLNTVDSVEVRDNGRGIHPSDFDSLGRRGHTSKLRAFDEIRAIGGKSLGFRGEALASANVLAKVMITTRTSGEPVAARLHLLDTGGVAKQEPASAPIGTTVRVSGLYSQLPVRRQTSIKEASKTISKLKDLLQCYALARVKIKYSFKVQGQPRLAWSYTPGRQATVREAVLRVLGHDLASQCIEITGPEAAGVLEATITDDPHPTKREEATEYDIEAFLPKPDADSASISKRAFVFVDSRPVSPSRGTAKKLVSMFRTHINRRSILADPSRHLKDPFIRINIQCKPGSYDPNIEPAKDNVLFVDEQLLLERFEALLLGAYPGPVDGNRDGDDPERCLQKKAEDGMIPSRKVRPKSSVSGASPDTTVCSNNVVHLHKSAVPGKPAEPSPTVALTEQSQIDIQVSRAGKLLKRREIDN